MNDHDEAIDRLSELEKKLNVEGLRQEDIHRVLKELIAEAIAVREHLTRLSQRDGEA